MTVCTDDRRRTPSLVTDDELGVVKLRHAPISLVSFRVLHEHKRVAVVVHGSMVESTHSFNASERLGCCREVSSRRLVAPVTNDGMGVMLV